MPLSNHPNIRAFQHRTATEIQIEDDAHLARQYQEQDNLNAAIANHNQLLANTRFNTKPLVLNPAFIANKRQNTHAAMTRLIQQLTRLGEYLHVTNADRFIAQDPVIIAASQAWISTSRMAQSVLQQSTTFNSPKYIDMLTQTLNQTMNLLSNPHDAHAMQALLAQSEFNRQTLEGPRFLRGLRASRYADMWYKACENTLKFSGLALMACALTAAVFGGIPLLPFEVLTGFAVLGLISAPIFALAALGTLVFQAKDRHFGLSRELSPQNAKELHMLAETIHPANYKEAAKNVNGSFTASVSTFFTKMKSKKAERHAPAAVQEEVRPPLYPFLSS